MKKNLIYISAALLAMVACNKENLENTPSPVLGEGETLVCLTGRIAGPSSNPSSKVEYNNTDGQFAWSPADDSIAVHVTAGVRPSGKEMIPTCYKAAPIVRNASDPSVCSFSYVMSEGQKRDFYALYPSSIADEEDFGDPTLKVTLPSSYDIDPAGMTVFSPTPMVAVNDADSDNLYFRHIGGLLRLNLTDVDPATKSISVSLGKRITGSFTVYNPDSLVPYIVAEDGEGDIVFNFTGALAGYTDNIILNVPVPTGTYESLRITAVNEVGTTLYAYSDEEQRIFETGRGRKVTPSVSTLPIPLCLEAAEPATVHVTNPLGLTMEYSKDNLHWTTFNTTLAVDLLPEECLYLRGDNEKYTDFHNKDKDDRMKPFRSRSKVAIKPMGEEKDDYNDRTTITTDGRCYIYGNIMSLVDSQNFEEVTALTAEATFANMFEGAADLINHPDKNLLLPALTLTDDCYSNMFTGCAGLTVAPELPATQLGESSYCEMFYECSSLRTPPSVLPADELTEYCYSEMFGECQALRSAPVLPATQLAERCYEGMFNGCRQLQAAPQLPAETMKKGCYEDMFRGCRQLRTAPDLPSTALAKGCYDSMFSGTGLTEMPALPATVLAPSCYDSMFSDCSSLVTVKPLPAETMTDRCYRGMFEDCTSLETAPQMNATTLAEQCFAEMFYGCSSLTTAPDLLVSTLAESCYSEMFYGCRSLETAPDLPATQLPNMCYNAMFENCSSLTSAPSFSSSSAGNGSCFAMFRGCTSLQTVNITFSTSVGTNCCYNMFQGCTSLTTAPALPAETISAYCYSYMFQGCTSLTTAPALPATVLATGCYSLMFQGCTLLTQAPELPALEVVQQCYSGMFSGCSQLNYVKALFVNEDGWAYNGWLDNVASTGTFVKNPAAQWYNKYSTNSVVPEDWTIVDAETL